MPLSEPKYHEILLRLADAGVEAMVVGMAAAVIQGAPTMTWDLDVVHHRTTHNVERPCAFSTTSTRWLEETVGACVPTLRTC